MIGITHLKLLTLSDHLNGIPYSPEKDKLSLLARKRMEEAVGFYG